MSAIRILRQLTLASESLTIQTRATIRHELIRTCRPNPRRSHWLRHADRGHNAPGRRSGRESLPHHSLSVSLHLTYARWLHRGRHAVDDRKSRASTPGRDGRGRILAGGSYQAVPVVRDPDVASRVNSHIGNHLNTATLENVDDIADFRAGGMTFGVVAG